jgi:hypothetical protein
MGKRKESVVQKKQPQTFKLIDIINGNDVDEAFGVTLTLSNSSTKKYELFRFGLADNTSNDEFEMDLDRETLKGLADFILKYLADNDYPNSHTTTGV